MFDLPVALIGVMFFSGWLPMVFSTILVLALILEVANDRFLLGYFTLFVYSVVLAIFTEINPFTHIWNNPLEAIGFLIGYFLIGAGYSVVKYRAWLKDVAIKIGLFKEQFIRANSINISVKDEIPESFLKGWKDYLYNHMEYDDYKRIKSGFGPGYQKDLILNWIAFWPFSAVGLLVAEPLEKFVNFLYNEMVAVYRNIYTRIISKYINVTDIENLK
ncbi:MAG: hypothetical protein CTY12_03355 [Methylotenera sp.]|nr:MAG: hypothetical protein CTY12_03355 [Methylotenera sp.]